MPLELKIWNINDDTPKEVDPISMDYESRLETILFKDISIASPNWMLIGRQVQTSFGGYIDLLAIDRDGKLIVIELKKNLTPREVVAQLLDYASWVQELRADDISGIFDKFQDRYNGHRAESLDAAFCAKFNVPQMPQDLNDEHELVIVAAELDNSTERIVGYLAETYSVPVNAVFFRVFKDGDNEFLTRAWLRDPTGLPSNTESASVVEWNGECYVSFWTGFDWSKAAKLGYIAAGGGEWYSRTLWSLKEGDRIWVNMANTGYLGVGIVGGPARYVDEYEVNDFQGKTEILSELEDVDPALLEFIDEQDKKYVAVPVDWIKTVPRDKAIKETGFFGNQNTVCRPVAKKWVHTINRLKKRFEIAE